jgi:hypothetical protein
MTYMFVVILLLTAGVAATMSRHPNATVRRVLAHLTPRERLFYYGLPAAVGAAIALTGVLLAVVVRVLAPLSATEAMLAASAMLAPILAVAALLFRRPVRAYHRNIVANSRWAKEQGIAASQLDL